MVKQQIKIEYKQTEFGIIPKDWNFDFLENISTVKSGKRIPKGNSLSDVPTKHPYIRVKDMKNGGISLDDLKYVPDDIFPKIRNYIITKDDIYISVAGTIGLIGKIPSQLDGANLTENANRLTEIKCNRDYLLYILTSPILKNFFESVKTIGAQPKLAIGQIKKFIIPLPSTNKEQILIANTLSDMNNLISKLNSLIRKKKKIQQATMQELLTRKKRLNGFNKVWKEFTIDSLCKSFTKQTGFDYTTYIKPKLITKLKNNTIPFIQNKNFKSKKINFNTDYYVPEDVANNFPRLLLDEPCLLISISENIGNVGFVSNVQKSLFGGDIAVGKFRDKNQLEWVMWYLLSKNGQKMLQKSIKASSHSHLTLMDIRSMKIPIPELDERFVIIKILSNMYDEIDKLEQELNKYTMIKNGVMHKLLTGEIRLV